MIVKAGGDPNHSEISIIAPSMRDKSLAPQNNGTLTLYMPAFMDYENEWETRLDAYGKRVRGEAYQLLKKRVADILIARVETKTGPGTHIFFMKLLLRLRIGVIQAIKMAP
ncbi:MAG: hypothetical protein WDM78_05945 [Puia sp.]